jgi:hypothetical protein
MTTVTTFDRETKKAKHYINHQPQTACPERIDCGISDAGGLN